MRDDLKPTVQIKQLSTAETQKMDTLRIHGLRRRIPSWLPPVIVIFTIIIGLYFLVTVGSDADDAAYLRDDYEQGYEEDAHIYDEAEEDIAEIAVNPQRPWSDITKEAFQE